MFIFDKNIVMKSILTYITVLILLIGCNHPGLTEKQRQQLKEGKLDRNIRVVNESDILEATVQKGNEIVSTLKVAKDSISEDFSAVWLNDTIVSTDAKQNELQQAYHYSKENGLPSPAHVKILGNDSLFFAQPATINDQNGICFVYLNKKKLVKTIN